MNPILKDQEFKKNPVTIVSRFWRFADRASQYTYLSN